MALFYDILIALGLIATALPAVILLYHKYKTPGCWENKHPKIINLFVIILSLGFLLIFYGSFVEPKLLITNYQEIDLDKINSPIKIALISDIHVGEYNTKEELEKKVERIIELDPDIVFIAGDNILADYKMDDRLTRLEPLKLLVNKFPVYAVPGNHDYGAGSNKPTIQERLRFPNHSKEVAETMQSLGVNYLENETRIIEIRDEKFLLFGGDEFLIDALDFASLDEKQKEYSNLNTIAIIHNPRAVYEANEHGVNLVLSGHTHGGQVRLPFRGPTMHIEATIPISWYQGLSNYNDTKLFVTSGINESSTRARLFNPPEIALLTIY